MNHNDEIKRYLTEIVARLDDPAPRSRLAALLLRSGDDETAMQLYLDAGRLMFESGLTLKAVAFTRLVSRFYPEQSEPQALYQELLQRGEGSRQPNLPGFEKT